MKEDQQKTDLGSLLKEDFFSFNPEKIKELKLGFFRDSFEHHYRNCPEYQRYCDMNEVKPEDIQTYKDLEKIQPVPADAFRDSDKLVLSISEEEIKAVFTTSSTTSPNPVRYAFSEWGLKMMPRINGALWGKGHEFKRNGIGSLFFLAPRPEESDTGLVKGGYLSFKEMGIKDERIYFAVQDGKIDAEELIKKMKNTEGPIAVYGPPFAYLPFLELWKSKGGRDPLVSLSQKARLITTGGWKGVKQSVTKEELMEQMTQAFNIHHSQIRDGYGNTDNMTMFPECEYHKKHVPLWNHISIRDPEDTSKELEPGQEGLVVLMASWIESYPAYCMTGDMGYVNEKECECGRKGQTVEITGRAKGSGARGCAIRLEQFMDAIKRKESFEF